MNRLPEVRRFLKDGHATSYENVSINWSPGASPTLEIMHDDGNVEKLDITDFTTEALHELLVSKGFMKIAAAAADSTSSQEL